MTWYDEFTNTRRVGIAVALYPYDDGWGIEIQRAPDDGSGDPDVGNVETIAFVSPGGSSYLDLLPLDGANRHYRSRHFDATATPSSWTGWTAATPVAMPDPLPPVQTLIPTVDVAQTISSDSISFTVTANLGEIEAGVVEFLDPERNFTATGSITAADKTLVVSDGDFTDEDVNLYVSVADAGVAGGLLESRIDSVTGPTTVELEDAATGTVANKNVVVGGGFFDDFDYDGAAESSETNTRNRPSFGGDVQYITFRAVSGGEVSSTQVIAIQPTPAPTISGVLTQGHDDGTDIDWSSNWTKEGSTNSTDHDLTIQYSVDDVIVEQETGVSVDESQPYLHSTSGAGGLPGGEIGSAVFILELKADNSTLDSKSARGKVLTT